MSILQLDIAQVIDNFVKSMLPEYKSNIGLLFSFKVQLSDLGLNQSGSMEIRTPTHTQQNMFFLVTRNSNNQIISYYRENALQSNEINLWSLVCENSISFISSVNQTISAMYFKDLFVHFQHIVINGKFISCDDLLENTTFLQNPKLIEFNCQKINDKYNIIFLDNSFAFDTI